MLTSKTFPRSLAVPVVRQDRLRRKLAARLLGASGVTIYRCPKERSAVIEALTLCNTSGSQVTASVWHVCTGEDADDSTVIFSDVVLRANSTTILEIPLYVNDGDAVIALASTASVVGLSAFGFES